MKVPIELQELAANAVRGVVPRYATTTWDRNHFEEGFGEEIYGVTRYYWQGKRSGASESDGFVSLEALYLQTEVLPTPYWRKKPNPWELFSVTVGEEGAETQHLNRQKLMTFDSSSRRFYGISDLTCDGRVVVIATRPPSDPAGKYDQVIVKTVFGNYDPRQLLVLRDEYFSDPDSFFLAQLIANEYRTLYAQSLKSLNRILVFSRARGKIREAPGSFNATDMLRALR